MDAGKEKSSLKKLNNSRPNIFLHSFIFLVILSLQFFPFVFDVAAEDIPKIRYSVKPLDLLSPPSKEEIMAAGQLGGQLYPIHKVEDNEREMLFNISFGQAIQEWNKHNYRQAVNNLNIKFQISEHFYRKLYATFLKHIYSGNFRQKASYKNLRI